MRGDGGAPSQLPGAAPREAAAATSSPASVMPRHTARQATFDPSITDPPPSATTRSASLSRSSAARARTSSTGYARAWWRRSRQGARRSPRGGSDERALRERARGHEHHARCVGDLARQRFGQGRAVVDAALGRPLVQMRAHRRLLRVCRKDAVAGALPQLLRRQCRLAGGDQVPQLRRDLGLQQAERGLPRLAALHVVEAEDQELAEAADLLVDALDPLGDGLRLPMIQLWRAQYSTVTSESGTEGSCFR